MTIYLYNDVNKAKLYRINIQYWITQINISNLWQQSSVLCAEIGCKINKKSIMYINFQMGLYLQIEKMKAKFANVIYKFCSIMCKHILNIQLDLLNKYNEQIFFNNKI